MGTVAYVFAGGDASPPSVLEDLPEPNLVIAADSGLHHALALDCAVDLVVGDLDSADPALVAEVEARGAEVERHPAAKDTTDLELALLAARDRDCDTVIVIGGHGGRTDHFLANLLVLASAELSGIRVEARIGGSTAIVVRDSAELHGEVGDQCTLLPVGGAACGVATSGMRYPLRSETLQPGSTRGVSNELIAPLARVSLTDGVLIAILPHTRKASS